MSNGWISRLLGLRAEELSSSAGWESASRLRLPTLDERVSLYSRAVREQHGSGDEAYSIVRDRILDAMATDIASRAGINLPEEELEPPRLPKDINPNETGWRRDLLEYRRDYASARASLPDAFELSERFEISERQYAADLLADRSVASMAEAGVLAQAAAAQRIAPTRRPALRFAMLTVSIIGVAVIGGSATWLLTASRPDTQSQWAVVAPKSGKLEVAAQSSQNLSKTAPETAARNEPISVQTMRSASAPLSMAEAPLAKTGPTPSSSASAVVSPAQSPSQLAVASSAPSLTQRLTQRLTPEEIANLVKRGRELIAAGKLRDARTLLKRAAEAGDSSAALALATTYDPAELEKLKARDVTPDIAMAAAWYQKAKDLGLTAAGGALQGR